ncbi:MAG: hypothetical protein ACRCSN_19300 [Dermatophilaceae bacterium]
MNEFEAVINSLGEHVVSYVGKDNIGSVTIWADELTATADVAIVLASDTWEAEERAIDRMIEVRSVFLDEVAIDYRFDSAEPVSRVGSTKAATLQLA